MQDLIQAITVSVKKLYNIELDTVAITRPDSQFGDFATNVAMHVTKEASLPPKQIADSIVSDITAASYKWLRDVSVAGPGFINFFVTDTYLLDIYSSTPRQMYANKNVIAEYSDPNAFKSLHAGHLYTTLVGNAVANILEATGATVHRLNYGGDVGLHAGKAMWGIVTFLGGEYPEKLQEVPETERTNWLSQRYVEGNTAYESSDQQKQEIIAVNKRVYAIHTDSDHDSDFAKIYWACREWSYDGFKNLYNELQVHPFDEYIPESLVTPLGIATVEKGKDLGVFEESEGAVVYSEEKSGLHTRVFITSSGLPTYEAKELGLAMYKWQKYQFDKSLVITANDIVEYMKVLFSAIANFYPEVEQRTTHLTHGIIKLSGGRKMSSRTGNVLMAADIVESAIQANTDSSGKDDRDVAIGAIKYAFLKQRIGGDIIYDPEESISLNGNSGPYLQYAHARARSILAKSSVISSDTVENLDDHERLLAAKLSEYTEALDKAATDLMPHHICTYLYDLSQVFNRFYENSKVIGDDREQVRKLLVERYADTLKAGLRILGITAPDHM
jgi:arginyl-tRNA synthetase